MNEATEKAAAALKAAREALDSPAVPGGHQIELHASEGDHWAVHGANLVEEAYHMGGSYRDARRLLLDAWEGWTSGEPDHDEVAEEMLATWYALARLSGLEPEELLGVVRDFALEFEGPPEPEDEAA